MRDVILATLLAGFLAAAPAWGQDNGGNNNSGNNNGDSGGQPLDGDVRDQMESAMGNDLSSVNIHNGNEAATMSEEVGAQAYAAGNDVVLGNAETTGGERGGRLLAHELTHTLQQGQQSTATETDDTETDETEEAGEPDPRALRRRGSEERRQRRPERRIPD